MMQRSLVCYYSNKRGIVLCGTLWHLCSLKVLQTSNIWTFTLNYLVNGPVKLALVVWKATEGKSVMVVHDVSCAGNIFPCLGCKTPGSGLYNIWGVTFCPCSSNTLLLQIIIKCLIALLLCINLLIDFQSGSLLFDCCVRQVLHF